MVSLVGGPAETLARVQPVLAGFAGAVHHIGASGAGARAKLAVNALFGIQVAGLAELLAVLERGGLERAAAIELLASLPVTSPALAGVARLIARDEHTPQFPIELVAKDLGYQLAAAEALGAALPVTQAAAQVFAAANAAGYGGDNLSAIARSYFSATM